MHRKQLMMALGGSALLATFALGPSWHATISSTDGSSIAGSASVVPSTPSQPMTTDTAATPARPSESSEYTANITLTGAKANASLAWHVHEGKCGSAGAVVGTEASYKAVTTDGKGGGQSSASVKGSLTEGRDYSVNVHSGANDSDPVIACGSLSAGKKSMPDGQ